MRYITVGGSGRGRRGIRPLPVLFALLLTAGIGGCDFLDPTEVQNPRTTDEDLAGATEPVRALMPGLRAQMARATGSQVVISEVVSDNYSVQGTGINPIFDDPRSVGPSVLDFTSAAQGIYWNSQELRALADFILDEIAPIDDAASADHLAEAHYYRGIAYLIQGESFIAAPTEADGPARPGTELLQRAVSDFEASITGAAGGEFALPARAALARTHRLLGDPGSATQAAQQALGESGTFVFSQQFDATGIVNAPNTFTVQRSLKEFQPLPRLDFLDPKYEGRETPIPVAKAEEMHLILAEAALAGDDVETGRDHLVDAIELALSRPAASWTDDDQRLNIDLSPRPRSSEIVVRADPDSPFREGLVLDRPNVQIPLYRISRTSLSADSVAALTDADEVWHAFHLARQEIMFLEGRRMSDLGIRLPMMLREVDANPNISAEGEGTRPFVPDHIPPNAQMDRFDPASPEDAGTTEVTIRHDMNRILTANRVSPFLN